MAVYSLQSLYEPTAKTGATTKTDATVDSPPTVEDDSSASNEANTVEQPPRARVVQDNQDKPSVTVTYPVFAKPTYFENVDESSASDANKETTVKGPRVRVAGRRTVQGKVPTWEGIVVAQFEPKTFPTPSLPPPKESPNPNRFFYDRVNNLENYKKNIVNNPTMYYKNYDHKRQEFGGLGPRKRSKDSSYSFDLKSTELIKHYEGKAQDKFLEATKDQVPKKEDATPVEKRTKLLPAFPMPSANNQIEDLVEDHDNLDMDFLDDYTDYYDGDTSNRAHQMAFALGEKDQFNILLHSKKFGELVKRYGTKTDNHSLMIFYWRTHILWLAKTRTKPQLRKLLTKKHQVDPSKLIGYTKQDLICAITEREGIHLFWMGDFSACDKAWEAKKYKNYLKGWLKEPPPGLLGYYDPRFLKKYDFSTKGFKEFLVQ